MFYLWKLIELILYIVLVVLSGFIIAIGKSGTGIKRDYFIVALLILGVILWI